MKNLENLFMYLMFIGSITFGLVVSFTWDIPTEHQLGVLIFTILLIGLFISISFIDLMNLIKSVKNRNKYN
jgi:hypothetical protein